MRTIDGNGAGQLGNSKSTCATTTAKLPLTSTVTTFRQMTTTRRTAARNQAGSTEPGVSHPSTSRWGAGALAREKPAAKMRSVQEFLPTNRQSTANFRDNSNISGRGRPLHIGKHSTSASERKGQSCFHIGLPLCRRRPTLRDLLAENVVQTKCLQTIENKD